jgi:Xaa-Pro dipeptidase
MFEAGEILPDGERLARQAECRTLLAGRVPEAGGLMCFSRLSLYYLTGTLANGLLWLPREGEPVILARKGLERCLLESPGTRVALFRSYSEIGALCAEAGSPLTSVIAAETAALPWSLADLLRSRLPDIRFVPDGQLVLRARKVKSRWELEKMRVCGRLHDEAMREALPGALRPGMSEREISHLMWRVFFERGHCGMLRMGNYGEDVFLGHVSAGRNGNYPSHYNGPLGLKGEHPAVPFMGHAGSFWKPGEMLMLDACFCLEGYNTDKTLMYWAGPPSSVPDAVRRAYGACLEIHARAAASLRPGALPSAIWREAREQARLAGFSEGFMGIGGNKVHFLGHGVGLVVDEHPVLTERFDEPLEEGMTIAVEPKIGLPGTGMVGLENTFEVTAAGGACLTGGESDILHIE